jgi:hypothetical protein
MDFHKVPNITCHGNPSNGSCADIYAVGRMEGRDEINRRFLRVFERDKKEEPKIVRLPFSPCGRPCPHSAIVLVD